MVKILEAAIAEVATLPEAAQEQIGRELLEHVDNLKRLHADIEDGLKSLNEGKRRPLDIEDVIRRARAKYAKS
jgi:hypothetical protein